MPRACDDQSESAVESNVAIFRCAGTFCRQKNDSETTAICTNKQLVLSRHVCLDEDDIVMRRAVLAGAIVLAVALWGTATVSLGETFPSKVVKITAPYSAGAAPATFTRVVGE